MYGSQVASSQNLDAAKEGVLKKDVKVPGGIKIGGFESINGQTSMLNECSPSMLFFTQSPAHIRDN